MSHVVLSDGRRLAYNEAGPRDGAPVFALHGAIGSPQDRGPELDAVIDDLGIRYVMVNRPGFGRSDPAPGRTLRSFAADLASLADAIGAPRFAVVGVSAGGPYALACAHAIPERLTGVTTVGSPSPACRPWEAAGIAWRSRLALAGIAAAPGLVARGGDTAVALVRRHPQLLLRAMTIGADPSDRLLLQDPVRAEAATRGFLAATAGGVGGLVDDYVLSARPWGLRLEDIGIEVEIWHGARDTLVPPVHAVHLAARLPHRRVRFDPDEGHFFFRRRLREVLEPLATPQVSSRAREGCTRFGSPGIFG